MKKTLLTALLLGMMSTLALAAGSQVIKVGGGGAACKSVFIPVEEAFEAETGIKVDIKPSTPGQGLIELNDGHVDVTTSAVPFESMVKMAAKNGITINPELFKVQTIAANKTLVFTHKTNKVKKLSKKQLKDIFTGKITNWKLVGGADMPITVVWGIATPGQNELFTAQILGGEQVLEKAQEVVDYKDIRDTVAKNPGAIGIDPEGFVTGGTRNPKSPAINSPVIAVTKGPASPEVEKLLLYIKNR